MRSPFASHSWEPRFVIEHYRESALRAALELWRNCGGDSGWSMQGVVTQVSRSPEAFVIARPGAQFVSKFSPLSEPLELQALPAWIGSWLHGPFDEPGEALLPPEPSFDGHGARRFCVFWSHFRCEEADAYGSLVVLPKWIEIHK